ncbi:MAG: Cupin 2 conserved barrel domain protein [Microgenomates group bacterium GW2011_GWB1_44_8]|nr:MAG: Cupin 2 conserved barrel domain protein [Microgenomates group bacterium GW2011_GWB1_44_8]
MIQDIVSKAKTNTDFRQVLENGVHTQIVIMSIPVGGDIGEEIHTDNDQVLFLVEGEGKVILNGVESPYKTGDIVLVPAGTKHNFINTGSTDLKIITTYSPPHHPPGTIHHIKP